MISLGREKIIFSFEEGWFFWNISDRIMSVYIQPDFASASTTKQTTFYKLEMRTYYFFR
jgi:hypothetical protein